MNIKTCYKNKNVNPLIYITHIHTAKEEEYCAIEKVRMLLALLVSQQGCLNFLDNNKRI